MIAKKLTVVALAVTMMFVSFSIVSLDNAEAKIEFIEGVPIVGLDPNFSPNAVAWMTNGAVAVVVGSGDGAATPNAYVFDARQGASPQWLALTSTDLTQTFEGVCYDALTDLFWICGDPGGGAPSSVYWWEPGGVGDLDVDYPLGTYGSGPATGYYSSVAVDVIGNPLVVGSGGDILYYDAAVDDWRTVNNPTGIDILYGVDYNENDDRFYICGKFSGGKGVSMENGLLYTDIAPLDYINYDGAPTEPYAYDGGASYAWDFAGAMYSIAWNQAEDYGLVVGEQVHKVMPVGHGVPLTFVLVQEWAEPSGFMTYYMDVSWDTSTWNEAAIVGQQYETGVGYRGTYWRYYHTDGTGILQGHQDLSATVYECVAIKPPSSPKWGFIPLPLGGGGGVKINIFAQHQGTTVRINAAFPHIFDLGFWSPAAPAAPMGGGPSLLNTQVDPDSVYTFYVEANYTVGGADQWGPGTVGIDLFAWYDGDVAGAGSAPADPTFSPLTENARTQQFWITYTTGGVPVLNYPVAGPGEFTFVDHWEDPLTYGPSNDYHRVYINVSFGPQTYAADGNGFGNGAAWGNPDYWDMNQALNDQDSWDFNFTVYDTALPGAKNESYEEFGINEAVSISVTGNPTLNAPPGTPWSAMINPSQVTYASNRPYWVNVSLVDNLLLGGAGPGNIGVGNIRVQNVAPDVLPGNTDILAMTAFTGIGVANELVVWGTSGAPGTPLPIPLNGTQSSGPWRTDYDTPGVTTLVNWDAMVPAGIAEGSYWTQITYRIENVGL